MDKGWHYDVEMKEWMKKVALSGWIQKEGIIRCKLKGRMDKGGYYDMEIKGWMEKVVLLCEN